MVAEGGEAHHQEHDQAPDQAHQEVPLDRSAFLAFAKKVFLAYHRALATGESAPVRPYLDEQLRRRLDTGRTGDTPLGVVATDEYVATRVKVARILSSRRSDFTDTVSVRFAAADVSVPGGVVAEDWTFERPREIADRIADGSLENCPTCGGPLRPRSHICRYCNTPLAGGGWRAVAISPIDIGEVAGGISRPMVIAGVLLVSLLLGVLASIVVGRSLERGRGESTAEPASTDPPTRAGAGRGLTGFGMLEVGGALAGSANGDGSAVGGGDAGSCSAGAPTIAGASFTASRIGDRSGRITLTASVPPGSQGPGVYPPERRSTAAVAYEEVTPDGLRITQAWNPGATSSVAITITDEGNVVVQFDQLAPKATSIDPLLNRTLSGTLTFSCAR